MTHGYIINNTYYKHEKESGKLRMGGGSWTINLKEIDDSILTVRYKTEKAIYQIQLSAAEKKGFVKQFKGEPKLVVPIQYWKKENIYATV